MTDAEKIVIARGEVSAKDLELALRFLGRIGFNTELMDPAAIVNLRREASANISLPYTIDEITSSDQFLSREHFQEYRSLYAANLSQQIFSMAFGALVNRPRSWQGDRPTPEELGLKLKGREEAGFAPILNNAYQDSSRYVVQAGSFLNALDNQENRWKRRRVSPSQMSVLRMIAGHIGPKIQNTAEQTD